jgi:hypothetical protein
LRKRAAESTLSAPKNEQGISYGIVKPLENNERWQFRSAKALVCT